MPDFRPLLLLAPLLLWLGPGATPLRAQGLGGGHPGAAPQGPVTVSPFEPSVPAPTLPPPGGQGTVPGDAGQGGGGGDTGGPPTGGGDAGGGTTAPGPAPGRGQASRRSATPGRVPRPTARTMVTIAPGQLGDDWRVWWEMNKFDFIQLRRLEDPPYTGQGLVHETPAERTQRLEQVRAMVREEVAPELRALTHADDPAVRASSIVTLGKLHDAQAAALARQLLSDNSLDVRRAAMLALGVLDEGRAAWLLMHIATDSDLGRKLLDTNRVSDDDRSTALLAATLRGDDAAAGAVERLLDERADLPPQLLAGVCEAAGLLRSLDNLRALTAVALDDKLPEYVRSSATNALGRIGEPAVIPTLLQLLDGGLEPQRAATVALGFVAHPELSTVVDRLASQMRSAADAPTRHFSAISLGRIGGRAAEQALQAAFVDGRSDMRPWLALGLGLCERTDPHGAIPGQILEALEHEANSETTGAYLIALGLTGSPQVLGRLEQALAEDRLDLAAQAALALGLTRLPDAQPALREALAQAASPDLQRQIALGLGILGDGSTIPDLLELIRSTSNPYVASFAAIGVAFMGDANAIGPLLRVIERQGPAGIATTYAVAAVGQLFDVDRRPALSRLAAGDNYLARPQAVTNLLALGF